MTIEQIDRNFKLSAVEEPVLFYGSSITQGGCASRSDTDYVSRLCRMLDTDVLNLGFYRMAKTVEPVLRTCLAITYGEK